MVIDTWAKWGFEISHFVYDKVVNIGPIDFQLSLPLNIYENDRQSKFEVNVAKMANFQDPTFVPTLNEHNSAIFYPILMFDHTKMMSSTRQIECR